MDNEHLRTAITQAGLTLDEFADIVQVDVKTVQRWLAGRTPYPRHRARVAGALDTSEHTLWPDTSPPPAEPSQRGEPSGVPTDVLGGYGRATDRGAPDPLDLLRAAVETIEIVIADPAAHPSLVKVLNDHAASGCGIRMIVEDPDEQLEALLAVDGIEIRAFPAGEYQTLYRADEQLLVMLTSVGAAADSPPVIHLARRTDGGLFDRLAADFDDRWLQATPITSREQLRGDLANTELEPWTEPDQPPAADPSSLPEPSRPVQKSGPFSPDAPRRWPRRPA